MSDKPCLSNLPFLSYRILAELDIFAKMAYFRLLYTYWSVNIEILQWKVTILYTMSDKPCLTDLPFSSYRILAELDICA